MSKNKKFHYAGGSNTEESDAFIKDIVSNAPKRQDQPVVDRPHVEMVDIHNARAYYSEDKSSSIFSSEKKFKNSCSRIFIFFFSGLLLLAGLGFIVFGAVEKHANVLPVCPYCNSFVIALFVFGAVLFVIALWGIVAAKTRFKCLAFTFAAFVVLIAVVFFAAGVAAVVYETKAKDLELEKLWKDAVRDDKEFVCRFQDEFKCSGFGTGHCCKSKDASPPNLMMSELLIQEPPMLLGATDAPAPRWCYSNTTVSTWVTDVCVLDAGYPKCLKSNSLYTTTCDAKLRSEIEKHFVPIIITLFVTGLLLVITAVAAVRMTFVSTPSY